MIGASPVDEASSLNGLNLSAGDEAAIAIALTGGIQEMFALGPTALSEQPYNGVLRTPQTVTFNATQYSTTISSFATWASWMEGCTVQGLGDDNELVSATQLLKPFMRSSGAVTATVYADCIRLPDWVKNTMEPVSTPCYRRLNAATNREELSYWASGCGCTPQVPTDYAPRNKTTGEPCTYYVEPRYDPTAGALALFIRFNPMPRSAMPVGFRVKRKPPIVTTVDLTGESIVTVAGTLSPNAAGNDYSVIATGYNGAPIFQPANPNYILFFTGAGWVLQAATGGLIQQVNCWSLNTTSLSPVGTYTPSGANTGAATITASGSTDLVIPTDWHESILLPFAKKRFLNHAAINNPSMAAAIMEDYRVAKVELESFIPQIGRVTGNYH